MNTIRNLFFYFTFKPACINACRTGSLLSGRPMSNIAVTIHNNEKLTWSVASWRGIVIMNPSAMGFELKDEDAMTGNFNVLTINQDEKIDIDKWIPVVKSKHAEIVDNDNELEL